MSFYPPTRHFNDAGKPACGKGGRKPTLDDRYTDCSHCERSPAYKRFKAERAAEKAGEREEAKKRPLTLALAEVLGKSADEVVDLTVDDLDDETLTKAIALRNARAKEAS